MTKATVGPKGLPALVTNTMENIEKDFMPFSNVRPKDWGFFDPDDLEDLMHLFNMQRIKQATVNVFGQICRIFPRQILDPEGTRQ